MLQSALTHMLIITVNMTNKKAVLPRVLSFSIHIRATAARLTPSDTARPDPELPTRSRPTRRTHSGTENK